MNLPQSQNTTIPLHFVYRGRWAVLFVSCTSTSCSRLRTLHSPFLSRSRWLASQPIFLHFYEQFDFIPDAIYSGWAEGGYTLGQIFEWLLIPVQIAAAVLTSVGTTVTSHVSELAHVSIQDYEAIIGSGDLMGQVITPVMRGKLRQVLLSARIIVGVTRAPDPPAAPPPPTIINAGASGQAASSTQPIIVHAIMPPQEKRKTRRKSSTLMMW